MACGGARPRRRGFVEAGAPRRAAVGLNRTLHKGFRFGKLRALLPLTCAVLTHLHEVLACERPTLELERARVGPAPAQTVRFVHDPAALVGVLAAGRRPRCIAVRPCTLLGEKAAHESIRWRVATIETRNDPFERHLP